MTARFPLLQDEEGYPYVIEDLTDCCHNSADMQYWADHFMRQAPSVTRYALDANRFLLRNGAAALPEDEAQQAAAQFVLEWKEWTTALEVVPPPSFLLSWVHPNVNYWCLPTSDLAGVGVGIVRGKGATAAPGGVQRRLRAHQVSRESSRSLPPARSPTGTRSTYISSMSSQELCVGDHLHHITAQELDAMSDEERLQTLFEGVFAGNIFDLVLFRMCTLVGRCKAVDLFSLCRVHLIL
jgi:hypothetical protein